MTTPLAVRKRSGAVHANVSEVRAAGAGDSFQLSAKAVSALTGIVVLDLYELHGAMGSPGHFFYRYNRIVYTARGLVELAKNLREAGHHSGAERLSDALRSARSTGSGQAECGVRRAGEKNAECGGRSAEGCETVSSERGAVSGGRSWLNEWEDLHG
ncbi:MAG: hypothetical protein Q8M02_10495 [Candidatus Didemnitutus sp.]|nr:hypothetical protein [Candidatus Didemnitutus sp.]